MRKVSEEPQSGTAPRHVEGRGVGDLRTEAVLDATREEERKGQEPDDDGRQAGAGGERDPT